MVRVQGSHEGEEGVANERHGSRLLSDGMAKADMLVGADVPQTSPGPGVHVQVQDRSAHHKAQKEPVVPLQHKCTPTYPTLAAHRQMQYPEAIQGQKNDSWACTFATDAVHSMCFPHGGLHSNSRKQIQWQ